VTPFAIRYSRALLPLMVVLGLGPRRSRVELYDEELRVRMGWAFRATIPRASIVRGTPAGWFVRNSIGVHGRPIQKTWLVSGSRQGVVWLSVEPPARGRVTGFPVTIRRLGLSLEEPAEFERALGLR
jgi:hypothetical protein